MAWIYKIVNKVNGKIYVGQTITLGERIQKHIRELNANTHHNKLLLYDWVKYGQESFSFEVVTECEIAELYKLEEYYINKFNSFHYSENGHGYNLTAGYNGTSGRFGKDATRVKQVICLNNLKVYECMLYAMEEFKSTNIASCCNNKHGYKTAGKDPITKEKLMWSYYYPDKDDSYYITLREQKILEIKNHKHKGRRRLDVSKNMSKPVICLDTLEIYESCKHAGEKVGIHGSCIGSCCKGKTKSSKGMRWMFLDDYKKTEV